MAIPRAGWNDENADLAAGFARALVLAPFARAGHEHGRALAGPLATSWR